MKKIIILILVVLGAAALPIIGQKMTQSKLDSRVDELKTYGLEVKNPVTNSSYLNTSRHYELSLKDSEKFINYLSSINGQKLPSYTKSIIDGIVIGVDISYSHLAITSDIVIEIYPLKLPEKAANDLLVYDGDLYNLVDKMLKDKAFLYHINYSLASKDFDGYIKDMDEEYTDKNGEKVRFKILDVTFVGNGSLLKPQKAKGHVGTVELIAKKQGKNAKFIITNLDTKTDFKTQTTYTTSMVLDSMELNMDGNFSLNGSMNGLNFSMSSNTEDSKAIFNAKVSMKNFTMNTVKGDMKLKDFNYDVTVKDIDKDSFEEFRVVVAKADTIEEPRLQAELKRTMVKIFEKGLTIDLSDLSLGELELFNKKSAKGFSIKSNIVLKSDAEFGKKLNEFPAQLANNLTVDTLLKISKGVFLLLNQELPMTSMAGGFAKEDGDNYVFDIKLKDSKLSVNGKQL